MHNANLNRYKYHKIRKDFVSLFNKFIYVYSSYILLVVVVLVVVVCITTTLIKISVSYSNTNINSGNVTIFSYIIDILKGLV